MTSSVDVVAIVDTFTIFHRDTILLNGRVNVKDYLGNASLWSGAFTDRATVRWDNVDKVW